MSSARREHWDKKFQHALPSLTVQDPFFLYALEHYIEPSFPQAGTALDIADGLGRHALPLAQREWDVIVVDISKVALGESDCVAKASRQNMKLICADACDALPDDKSFDLVLLFYHFEWQLLPKIVAALKPGGLLVCKLRIVWDGEHPNEHGEDVPSLHDVPALFFELEVLHQQTRKLVHRGVLELVGRKR